MDTHTHTIEAIWVELFSSCGLWSSISPLINGSEHNLLTLFSNLQHPGCLAFVCRLKWYLVSLSLNREQQTLIWTACLSSRDDLNTRAVLSILRLEILCSRQDQEPRATQGSDIISLKVSVSSTGYAYVVRGKREERMALIQKSGQLQQELFLFGPPLQGDTLDFFFGWPRSNLKQMRHSLQPVSMFTVSLKVIQYSYN